MNKYTLGGIFGPVVFTIVVIVAAAMRQGYSHRQNFISELGATGSQNAVLMNYAGFVLGGLLTGSLGFALIRLPLSRSFVLSLHP